jgi:hypothetical protein
MGQLVFQATLGGQVNLVGPNTASTFNINVPAVAGNMVTTGDTGTVTNTMLASSAYTAPGTIGSGTANTGAFTTLSGSTSVTTPIVKSATSLVLQTNGTTTAATFDTAQNMGLGVTPKTSGISGYFELGADKYISSQGDGNTFASNAYFSSGWKYAATAAASRYTQYSGQHQWFTSASGSANAAITFTQAMTLDASGNLGIGSTSPNIGGLTRALTLNTPTGGNYSGVELAGAGTLSARFITNNAAGTYIGSQVSIPLVFETNATERARIDSSGNFNISNGGSVGTSANGAGIYFGSNAVLPSTGTALSDNSKSMGSASWRWSVIYAGTGTINTSDVNLKQDEQALTNAERNVATAIKGLIKTFRFKDAVAEKGDAARIHVGVMAQSVKAAFEAEGLDANRYALFCSDTWLAEETNEEKTRLGIRYDELLAFVIAAL